MSTRSSRLLSFSAALLLTGGLVRADQGVRDPFWPLGYSPPVASDPSPEAPAEAQPKPSSRPGVPAVVRSVSAQDWADAERALGIVPAKYSVANGADGTAFILLWGKIKSKGDLVNAAWNGVEFSWRVTEVGSSRAEFERLRAESSTK